jgi:hypothetical protein
MTDPTETTTLVDRYIALWNEPDPEARRTMIRELWSIDGAQILADPPTSARDGAADLRFAPPSFEVHGHDGLEARVTRAHEMFVGTGEYRFEANGTARALLDGLVTFGWTMVTAAEGAHAGGGVEVIDLAADGRIRRDYQFIERAPRSPSRSANIRI